MFKLTVNTDINLCLLHPLYAPRYLELVTANFEYLHEWLSWPPLNKTEEDFLQFIQDSLHKYANGTDIVCAIEYRGELVGNCGFQDINHTTKSATLGYWLAQNYQGKGIMTQSCQHLINYAFDELKLEKVELRAAEGNKPSRAVAQRLGMKLEGIISNCEKVGDRILSHAIYGIHNKAVV